MKSSATVVLLQMPLLVLIASLLRCSSTTIVADSAFDEEVLHIGLLLPFVGDQLSVLLASAVYADLEFGKYQDSPKHIFRRENGSLIEPYLHIPNMHPNLTRLRLHFRDTGALPQQAAMHAVEAAYGSEARQMPAMNAVVGPLMDDTTTSAANILGVLGVVQITPHALSEQLTNKEPYPYLFRVGTSNSEYGLVMWDYMDFFGFRGGHMLYEDIQYGNELRIGLASRAESFRRSGDISYSILPALTSYETGDGLEEALLAAEVAAAKVAQQLLTSSNRLIFLAIYNADALERVVKRKLLEASITAPHYQFVGAYAMQLLAVNRDSFEGHAPEAFHGFSYKTDYNDPSLQLFKESWLTLTADDILGRLPEYGLDAAQLRQSVETLAPVLQTWPPPVPDLAFDPHIALSSIYLAFNEMLNDGFSPPEIHGDSLRGYLMNLSFDGLGRHVKFNENRDVVRDMVLASAVGFDDFNRTVWVNVAIRAPTKSDGTVETSRVVGSAGPLWATGEWSWSVPLSLVACPLGMRFLPSTLSGATTTDDNFLNQTRPAYGTCEPCTAGRFSADYDSEVCEECPGGTISGEGSSECVACPVGTFASQGSSVCTPCFAGSFGNTTGASACESCLPGRFQHSYGQSMCEDCPAGTHAPSVRSELCLQCDPGSVAPSPRSAHCTDCSPGSCQGSFGESSCLPCQPGTYADATGQSVCFECKPGYHQPNSSSDVPCSRCPVGTYSEGVAAATCELCTFGTTLLLGADSEALCTCPTNTFLYESVDDTHGQVRRTCVFCNEYMEPCAGGVAPAWQKAGYHVSQDGQTVYQCMSSDACPRGPIGSCPIGSSGPGCAECDSGSYYWDGDECAKCTTGNALYVIGFPLILAALMLGTHRFGNDPIGRNHLSAISEGIVLAGLVLSALFYFSSFEGLDVDWREPVATLMDIAKIFSTELANMNFACSMTSGPSTNMAVTSATPLLALLLCLPLVASKRADPKLLFNTYGSILYATYLLLILHGLKPFRYIVHPLADRKSVLFMPSIFEHSAEHTRLILVGILVLLVYCVPFAALCGWASIAVMKSHDVKQRRLLLKLFRFLFYKFRPCSFYWGFYILVRNTIVGVTPSLFPESPSVGLFVLSAVIIQSAVATGTVWPWRARWMNFADSGILAYMALVLNLAVGWVRKDEDSSSAMATFLVIVAGIALFVAVVAAARLLLAIGMSGAEARARMRSSAQVEEEAFETGFLAILPHSDPKVEVADGFESLMAETSKEANVAKGEHLVAPALTWVSKKTFDLGQAATIASQIRKKDYSLQNFYEDCMSTFPELQLYTMSDGCPELGSSAPGSGNATSASSSGWPGEVEQMRTLGAFFAIYWICRLDIDGKQGMSFGVEQENPHIVCKAPADMQPDDLQKLPWGKMTPDQRRAYFFQSFNWGLMTEVFQNAGIMQAEVSKGKLTLDDGPGGRLVSLLCLTAFHDIMKCAALCPKVSGESYHGYNVGETIQDHDLALAYILDRHPHLLPSFRSLSEEQRHCIRFTQSDMGFNAGWLVQAEGPPGAVLGKIKKAITSGMASDVDVAFYFSHFLTDLAGAEPTPFRGAEKFSVNFPPKVLQGLLGCVGTVKWLAQDTETHVYESYLEKRWCEVSDQLGPVPKGPGRIAKLRLNCMSQHAAKPVLEAFESLNAKARDLLISELSETGVPDQLFSELESIGNVPQVGTPFLMYYGPAWCQRVGADHPDMCLRILASVLHLARQAFDESSGQEQEPVSDAKVPMPKHLTVQLAALRTIDVADLEEVMGTQDTDDMAFLHIERLNHLECSLSIAITSA